MFYGFLANVNSRLRYMLSPFGCLSSVCLWSVCNARAPYSGGCNFRHFYGIWYFEFYGDRPRGTPPTGELNPRGVPKYSDFGPIEGLISERVQDTSYVSINH